MMEFLNTATDNEMAVLGCLAALGGSLGVMLLSGTIFGRPQGKATDAGRRSAHLRGEAGRTVVGRGTVDQEAA